MVCGLTAGLTFAPLSAWAGKLDVSIGYFQINAQVAGRTGSISNFGLGQLAYRHALTDQFEATLGYSIVMSSGIGGELGYGLDLGLNWYPFTNAAPRETATPSFSFVLDEQWRPYVGPYFYQRQYPRVQTGYAGVGLEAGVERSISSRMSLKPSARFMLLSGPKSAAANELDLMIGLSFQF